MITRRTQLVGFDGERVAFNNDCDLLLTSGDPTPVAAELPRERWCAGFDWSQDGDAGTGATKQHVKEAEGELQEV